MTPKTPRGAGTRPSRRPSTGHGTTTPSPAASGGAPGNAATLRRATGTVRRGGGRSPLEASPEPARGELDRQGDPVQVATDLHHRTHVVGIDREPVGHGSRS